MSLIRVDNVSKSYDDRPVLREVFFRLSAGDRAGLIGKNGSGKTTRLLIFEGAGRVREVNGNWSIWQASKQTDSTKDTKERKGGPS